MIMPDTDATTVTVSGLVKSLKEPSDSEEKKPADFFWDRLVLLLAAIIVSLGVVDAVADFFRESNVHCTTKSGQLTRDQVEYANGYCYGFLPWHSRSEFLVIFLVVQSALVTGVHLVWSEFAEGDIRFLYDSVGRLGRTRDSKTGKYKERNVEIVKLAQRKFEGQRCCSLTYVVKLIVQIAVYVTSIVLFLRFFSGQNESRNFECPEGFNTTQLNLQRHAGWALSVSVTCYHTSLSTLIIVKWANVVISCISVLILLYGIASFFRLPRQVDYCNMAKFALETGLHPDHYFYHRACFAHVHALHGLYWWDDFKFLTLRLLMESVDKGVLLRKMIIQMEMSPKSKSEKESCHCSPRMQGANNTLVSLLKKLHDAKYEWHPPASDGRKVVPAPQYKKIFPDAEASVLGVMFGSTSLAHVLYHSFQFLKPSRNKSASCYFINFDFYLNEDSEPVKERIAPGHQDILLLPVTGKAWKKKLQDEKQFVQQCSSTDLVVIGPLLNYEHCDIVNDLLPLLLNDAGAKGTRQSSGAKGAGQMVVLTIFPLKIGGNDVSKSFIRYGDCTSCKQLKGINKIRFVSGEEKEWTGAVKHKVTSADVDYEFEFTFYSADKKVQ